MKEQRRNPRGVVMAAVILASACVLAGVAGWRVLAADKNPHEPQGGPADALCQTCHKESPGKLPEGSTRTVLPNLDDFKLDPVAMCLTCHKEEESAGSHPVGARPDYPVPADLPLDREGRVSCLTCHHVHGRLASDHQCASASALDRLFNRKHLRKSFLLRRDNPQGELCKACHQTRAHNKEKQP